MRKICICFAIIGLLLCTPILEAQAVPENVQVPVIMYHSLAGAGANTSISGAEFEADLQYLQEMGYQSVTLADLAGFVHHGTDLPERPVVLTFDDGYWNNYSVGLPLAQKYSMPIVISVIGKDTEIWSEIPSTDLQHGHVTWDQIREMAASGLVEIANHTWDLHKHADGRKGAAIRPGEDAADYRMVLQEDAGKLQRLLTERCGVMPIAFVYPFGRMCDEAEAILGEMGFLATLSCRDGVNAIVRGDGACLFGLRRFERTPGRGAQGILEGV
ncbi:MAG: polysaccharide deacetylase family protein [Oscillospiraceae bacterium]|nr:polysaccharide deacetylase family protein [Oscillospiraceae bacterium]